MTKNVEKIHPILDFTAEHAYIVQLLPYQKADGTEGVKDFFIRDDRKAIANEEQVLKDNGIELSTSKFLIMQRWSVEGITKFIQGEKTVKPKQLYDKIRETLKMHVELNDERLYDFLTLWTIGTYFSPLFNAYPYVYVGGIKKSGKTKLLTLSSCIAFNSVLSANMTTATLYRLIQNERCSLFVDETEQLSSKYRAAEFRNLLLSGYKKGLKTYRNRKTADGDFVPEPFEVYGPKMLANIEGLEDVLESRCITIIMQRSSNKKIGNKEVDESDSTWQQIRDIIYPFVMENWKAIRKFYSEIESDTNLSGRDWELWKPMLTLAKFFGNSALFERMSALAIEKTEESQLEDFDTHEFTLVESLLDLVTEDGFYKLIDITRAMHCKLESSSWLTVWHVGKMLRSLGFTKKRRVGSGMEYFLEISEINKRAKMLGVVSEDSVGSGGQEAAEEALEVVPNRSDEQCQEESG